MLRKLVDNEFTNAATFYIVSLFLLIISPPLLLFKIIYNFLVSFRPTDANMRGKVVLITGASSGIGECLAYEYAKREALLVIVARREQLLQKVAEKARGIGSPDVLVICGDVSDFNDCRRFIDEAINHFGRLDHLVNNAGIGSIFMVNEGIDITKFAPVMDINFWGSIYPSHFAIPHLKKTNGTIIVNASTAAYFNLPRSGFYSASKSAVTSFYESLRAELGPEIKITIVTLGYVESEMTLGKQMSKEGEMKHNQEIKDLVFECFPVMSTEPCAKAIVKGACRGDRWITEPQFMRPFIAFNFFFPELVQWHFKKFYLGKWIAATKAAHK
ncbi:11-beta-hydroxysteroid dehydrogenase-like [Henckelia pumila]|uniref:11-beta-hydroxysteroid dehydrogenase-like n=1 Tax=Henckelia pumila TaxID=405737 RepID=UPI003C6E838A